MANVTKRINICFLIKSMADALVTGFCEVLLGHSVSLEEAGPNTCTYSPVTLSFYSVYVHKKTVPPLGRLGFRVSNLFLLNPE